MHLSDSPNTLPHCMAGVQASAVLDRLVGPRQLDVMQVAGRINLSTTGRIMFGYDFACRDVDVPCKFWQVICFVW